MLDNCTKRIILINSMYKKIYNFLLSFLELQLFVSLISWPLLIAWGIPLSWATPVGNLVFNPFLSFFIFISSLCFFTELLYIPNSFFIWLLEKITHLWFWCISWGTSHFLLYFPKPPFYILMSIALCALLTLITTEKQFLRIICFSFFFIIFGFATHYLSENTQFCHVLEHTNKRVILCTYNKKSYLLVETLSSAHLDNWVLYTLQPLLIQATGKNTLDALIVTKKHSSIVALEKYITINTIIYQELPALHAYTTQLQADQTDLRPVKSPDA